MRWWRWITRLLFLSSFRALARETRIISDAGTLVVTVKLDDQATPELERLALQLKALAEQAVPLQDLTAGSSQWQVPD